MWYSVCPSGGGSLTVVARFPHPDPDVQGRQVASVERVQVANARRRVQWHHVRQLLREVTYLVIPETIAPYLEALRPAIGQQRPERR